MTEENFDDLDALLDVTLDDLEDLPEFKPFSAGAHTAILSLSRKTIADHPAIEASFKLMETLELSDTNEDNPSKPGDEATTAYFLDNEFGRGKFKKLCKPLAKALGVTKLSEIVEQCQGIEVAIVTNIRVDKNDTSKKYLNIMQLDVV
jgi:hypothetical protein